MAWTPFKGRKRVFLRESSSSSSSMILNFCLGSQPRGIPLILHRLPFCFQPIKVPYIVFHIFFFFSLTFSTPFFHFYFLFFLSLSFLSFLPPLFPHLFCRYSYKRGFGCFILILCPLAPTFLGILGTAGFEMS